MLAEPYSRYPVYVENIDHIVGVLYLRDAYRLARNPELSNKQIRRIKRLLRAPYFIPQTKNIDELFREMQAKKIQMAIVVDEYGGTLGMVTMEDIMEEIVGEIYDERDAVENEIVQIDAHTCIVDGDANLYDLFDIFDYEPQDFDSEYNTVGGWATEQLDRFHKAGDEFTFDRYTYRGKHGLSRSSFKRNGKRYAEPLET